NTSICGVLLRCDAPGMWIAPDSRNACDVDLFLRLGQHGHGAYVIDEDVVFVHQHSKAESAYRSRMTGSALLLLSTHLRKSSLPKRLYDDRAGRIFVWSIIELISSGLFDDARSLDSEFG